MFGPTIVNRGIRSVMSHLTHTLSKENKAFFMTDDLKSSKPRILVLGVGGNVSIGILRAIKDSDIDAHVFGACVQKYAAGFYFCEHTFISPMAMDKRFLPWLKATIKQNNINLVLSGVEEVIKVLTTVKISTEVCKILTPDIKTFKIFSDKMKTANWLKSHGISHPKTLDLRKHLNFSELKSVISLPFIVKPRMGKGSSNVSIIMNEKQFIDIDQPNLCVAQQLIGNTDTEYTCGIYRSKFNYTEIIIMRRLLRNGSTVMAEVVENQLIYDYCYKIAETSKIFGPLNIQLRLCTKTHKPYCFEINMRLSGTTSVRHGFGFKDCQVWIKEMLFDRGFRKDFDVKPAIAIRHEAEIFLSKNAIDSINKDKPTMM